jgi:hypothetical protein
LRFHGWRFGAIDEQFGVDAKVRAADHADSDERHQQGKQRGSAHSGILISCGTSNLGTVSADIRCEG